MSVYAHPWDSEAPESSAKIELIDHFSARGMKCVYGRGDIYKSYCTYNMDIWKNKHDRLYMRFWSRYSDIDWESYEITGVDISKLPVKEGKFVMADAWIPKVVRVAYDEWIAGSY